jgi:exodeoxyribonuclease III
MRNQGADVAPHFPSARDIMPQKLRLASWNINSIKMRQDHVASWLQTSKTDILFLQELKGLDFPISIFEELGFHSYVVPQKAYNGVAVLSRWPLDVTHRALPNFSEDPQARYCEVECQGLTLINIYLPNGNPVGTEKFDYKLQWMDHLFDHLKNLRELGKPVVIGGDFNIIPQTKDCFDPLLWAQDALFHPLSLERFRKILYLGFTDAFRIFHDQDHHYSFWDYQAGAWQQNKGIRIDHFLTSPKVTDCVTSCSIDKTPRGWDKPSDHTPIVLDLDWEAPN